MVYARRRRVFRRRRRPRFVRRKFKRRFGKQRRGRTVTRRRRRRNYAVRTVACSVQEFNPSLHVHDCTQWLVSDIPMKLRTIWLAQYEKVKFLKVTFKYWVTTQQPGRDYTHKTNTMELRYSYDPDNAKMHMMPEQIMLRRNAKHIIGARLNRPWYFKLRPTFSSHLSFAANVGVSPWFDTCEVFNALTPIVPYQRNAYLRDFKQKFEGQVIACQRYITVGNTIPHLCVNAIPMVTCAKKMASTKGKQGKRWCFTINNWSDKDVFLFDGMLSVVGLVCH